MKEWPRFFDAFNTKLTCFVKCSGQAVGPICREQLHEALDAALDALSVDRTETKKLGHE